MKKLVVVRGQHTGVRAPENMVGGDCQTCRGWRLGKNRNIFGLCNWRVLPIFPIFVGQFAFFLGCGHDLPCAYGPRTFYKSGHHRQLRLTNQVTKRTLKMENETYKKNRNKRSNTPIVSGLNCASTQFPNPPTNFPLSLSFLPFSPPVCPVYMATCQSDLVFMGNYQLHNCRPCHYVQRS